MIAVRHVVGSERGMVYQAPDPPLSTLLRLLVRPISLSGPPIPLPIISPRFHAEVSSDAMRSACPNSPGDPPVCRNTIVSPGSIAPLAMWSIMPSIALAV